MLVCGAARKVGRDRHNHQSHPIVRTLGRLGDYPQATLPKNPVPSDCKNAFFAELDFVPHNPRLNCFAVSLTKKLGEGCDHFNVVVHVNLLALSRQYIRTQWHVKCYFPISPLPPWPMSGCSASLHNVPASKATGQLLRTPLPPCIQLGIETRPASCCNT